MQSTIEGLLNNLAASESAQEESFAPPEPSEESFSPTAKAEPVAHRVMDLLESLESGETTEAPETKSAERHEHQSMPEESSSGDSVDDLFGESQAASERAEAENEPAATESANESAPSHTTSDTEALVEEASETVEQKDEESSSIAESTAQGQLESAPTAENETKSEPEPTDSKEREPEADSTEAASAETEIAEAASAETEIAEAASAETEIAEVASLETEIEVPSSETASTDLSKTESVESEVSEPASTESEAPPPSSERESAEAEAEAEEQEKPHAASESSKAEESPDEEELAETPEDKPAVAEESPEVVRAKAQLKEFGKLSVKPATASSTTEPAGTMKSIGKLLIDVAAVENIIKAGESGTIGSGLSTARVISAQRGEGIKALLNKIDTFDGVVGSVIVGHDGLVIASTVTGGMDKDTLGVLSVSLCQHSNLATKKLEIGKLRQMVMLTDKNLTVLTDVDVGILAVFLSDNDVGRVDGVLGAIHDTIHGN
jgi:predicted regulator of Ras-like GTPase activity (Roadblock/LC7/MglB family)